MAEKSYGQQQNLAPFNDFELKHSLSSISDIMEKINETVLKSQRIFREDEFGCTTNQQNILSRKLQEREAEVIEMLKNKVKEMRIPLNLIHRKNKLSTVMEESQSQSGRTNVKMVTPREHEVETQKKELMLENNLEVHDCIRKGNYQGQKENIGTDQFQKVPKKIMGIRKRSASKPAVSENSGRQSKADIKQKCQKTVNSNTARLPKTKSLSNFQYPKGTEYAITLRVEQKNVTSNEIENEKQETSKGRKGLSVYSKHLLISQNSDKDLRGLVTSNKKKSKIVPSEILNSDRRKEKQEINTNTRTKKRTMTQLMAVKQQVQLDRNEKITNEMKIKSQLSRTNIRDFFVSKRIHR